MDIEHYTRPLGTLADEILAIVVELTGEWFSSDVGPATRRDLAFQDVMCARDTGAVRAFIMFTSLDGAVHITLMGTSPRYRSRGLGSALLECVASHAAGLGFDEIVAFTVPPGTQPAYQSTLDFYLKRGFRVAKRYTELWQGGAWELRRTLGAINTSPAPDQPTARG